MENVLRTQRLIKWYGRKRVVNDVSLEVRPGEIVGLLGPNGAGKTTIFYMIVGFVKPDGGDVFLDGIKVTGLPMYVRARKGIGYLAQEPSVFRGLTVEENILAVLELLGYTRAERVEIAEQVMEELGIKHLAKQRSYTLSGGERRRLEIARALAISPRYLLLDEPFTGVDPIAIEEIKQIILHLKEEGYGILITDHNVRETLTITDRSYIICEGKVLLSGTAQRLLEDPLARQVYLGEKFSM